jgi:iron-sulfur cluster repair protein YtfE (RIC family)
MSNDVLKKETSQKKIGEIVAEDYRTATVFEKYGIDFCCGGQVPLGKLYREHEEIGDAVHETRRLANDYAIPEDACNTFTLTYRELKAFEDDLHRHVHLENNILFLKADQILNN